MSTADLIENVRASFAMENLTMTFEDERRGHDILTHKKSIDEVIEEIKNKYKGVSEN